MAKVNAHEIEGRVLLKKGPYAIGDKGLSKYYLYVEADYMQRGKITPQVVKAVTFAWGDHASKISQVLPGDEVRFAFTFSGKIIENKFDFFGAPQCWTEVVIESKVEVLSTSQRQLYDNEPKDDLGVFDTPPKFQYKDADLTIDKNNDYDPKDLPF